MALAQNVNATISTTAAAGNAGALDGESTWTANGWYYVWVIYNGTSSSAIASISSSNPMLPSGYSFAARVGAVRTSSSATSLLATLQYGRRAQYQVGGANVSALPLLAGAGVASLSSYSAVSISGYVPPTAASIRLTLASTSNGNVVMVAPNGSYGAYCQLSSPPPLSTSYCNGY